MNASAADIRTAAAVIPYEFDFGKPDYVKVFRWRAQFLERIREKEGAVDKLKRFYAANPIQFIVDWGVTFDPRNVEIGLPSKIPFVPFPKQIEWLEWVLARWRMRERGLTDKSRGSGVSWLAVCLASTLCLFNRGITIGFGSRKAEYVDTLGDPKSLFFKARMFLNNIPPDFRCGWIEEKNAREMRISYPQTESVMTGEAGDSIGRGDRTSMFFVDEAAFLEHPELAESSLSDTTNCRIDISTPPTSPHDNAFVDRRNSLPERQIFTFHFRDDPRRDKDWEEKKRRELAPEIFKREYEVSYDESGSFFVEESFLVKIVDSDGKPILDENNKEQYKPVPDFPQKIDAVFATIDTAVKTGKEHDGLAVVYGAICRTGVAAPLTILDWNYTQIEGALLEAWLPTVFQTLEHFANACHARMGNIGAWIEDKQSGSVLLQQGLNHRWNVHAIDSKLTSMGKSERAINVSGYVHRGQVKFTKAAYDRVVNFKGITKNHLLSQVLGFRPGNTDDVQDDCLDCFTYITAISLGNSEGF